MISFTNNIELSNSLIIKGANVNFMSKEGATLLIIASNVGCDDWKSMRSSQD